MTFSLISVAILLITALVIVIEAVRAIRRGRKKTLITFASILLSVFVSMLVTKFLSDLFAKYVVKFIKSAVDITNISDKLASIDEILFAYSDAVIAPLTFLVVFILVRLLIALVIKIVYNINQRKGNGKLYECEDAPDSKKKPKLVNGLFGALCGFMVMVIVVSPFMGTLKIATKAFKNMNKEGDTFNVRIKDDALWYFDRCSDDFIGSILYYSGGILVYKAVSSSELNDNHFALEKEIDNTFSTAGDLLNMGNVLENISVATEEEKNMLRNLGGNVDKSETLKSATADILPVLSKKWINDESYEGISKPKVSKASESFFDKMLYVCTKSTADTVGADLSSLLNVYLIAFENDILISENYKDMIERAKMTGAFDLIKSELSKNPRMAGLDVELDTLTIKSIASAIQNFNFENYDNLMSNISNILNQALSLDGQQRLNYVAQHTKTYINQHGIDVGDDVVKEISERLVDELVDHRTNVTVDDIKSFWDKYSVAKKNNSSTDSDTDSQPTPENPPQTNEPEIDNPIEDDLEDNGEEDVEIFPEEVPEEENTDGEDSYIVVE